MNIPSQIAVEAADRYIDLDSNTPLEAAIQSAIDKATEELRRELNKVEQALRTSHTLMKSGEDRIAKMRDEWKQCAKELAKELTYYRTLNQQDTLLALDSFNKLKGQTE